MATQVSLRISGRATRLQIAARRVQRGAHRGETARDDVALARARQPEGDVRFSPRQAHGAGVAGEIESELGVLASETMQVRSDESRSDRFRDAHANGACDSLVGPCELALQRDGLLLHALRPGQQVEAGLSH